mmetsp:Transcript_18938/g.52168  ORF Transcript_18938/g.52168 Transcript_18938/m.52168 type:complete len:246 (-) Transcript_18938:1113-1850(-)
MEVSRSAQAQLAPKTKTSFWRRCWRSLPQPRSAKRRNAVMVPLAPSRVPAIASVSRILTKAAAVSALLRADIRAAWAEEYLVPLAATLATAPGALTVAALASEPMVLMVAVSTPEAVPAAVSEAAVLVSTPPPAVVPVAAPAPMLAPVLVAAVSVATSMPASAPVAILTAGIVGTLQLQGQVRGALRPPTGRRMTQLRHWTGSPAGTRASGERRRASGCVDMARGASTRAPSIWKTSPTPGSTKA